MGQRRLLLPLTVVAALATLVLSSVSASAASTGRSTLKGSIPGWASSKNFKGAVSGSDYVGFRVYLGWNNDSAVTALAKAVSTPGSASYGKYLTPQQFHQQFAPSQTSVSAVKSWLTSQGFTVDYTPANNHYIAAEGTVAQAAAAFGTSFGYYAISGKTLRSPSTELSIPTSIAGIVNGVIGLDESPPSGPNAGAKEPRAPPPAAAVTGTPCSVYWGEQLATGFTNPYGTGTLPCAPCGVTPQQVKGAYGLSSSSLDGAGQTVAVIDAYAAPTIVEDVNQWSINRGLPTLKPNQFTQVVAPCTAWPRLPTSSSSARRTTSKTSTPRSTTSSTGTWHRS